MHTVRWGASEIAYGADREGRDLVLPHGTGGDAESNWGPMLPRLLPGRRILWPEYSGSGDTLDDGSPLILAELEGLDRRAAAELILLTGYSSDDLSARTDQELPGEHLAPIESPDLAAGVVQAFLDE